MRKLILYGGLRLEKLTEKRNLIILISIGLLCCIVTSVLIIRQRNLNAPLPEAVPLSAIVLQPGDLPQSFLWTGRSSSCSQYLALNTVGAETTYVPSECYQVRYALADNSVIVLNAIWKFNDAGFADSEFVKAIEFIPTSGKMEINVLTIPVVGEKSSGLLARIDGGLSVISTYDLFWKTGAAISRITLISNQNTISQNDLIVLAAPVQARLAQK